MSTINTTDENIQNKRVCKQCLLRDFPMDQYFQEMNAQINAMDPEYRVEDEVYEARLMQCRSCEYLAQGMCRVCGCYVEWRAALRYKACPQVHPRWGTEMI